MTEVGGKAAKIKLQNVLNQGKLTDDGVSLRQENFVDMQDE